MKKRLLIIASVSLSLFFVSMLLQKIQAQKDAPGILVHPSNISMTLLPGKASSGIITLENTTNEPLHIGVVIKNFTAQGEEGAVSLTNEDTSYSLAKWIHVTPMTAIISEHGSQKFSYTVISPLDAEPGGHFGSVIFGTIPSPNVQQTGAAISQQVASLFLGTIPGEVQERATIDSFTPDKNFYENGPVQLSIRVKNSGQIHIIPEGEIVVVDMFGHKTYLPFQGRTVLPNAIRKMTVPYKQQFLLGKYTAHLIAGYGTKNQQLNASTEFYAFPVKDGLIAGVGVVVLFLLRKRLFKALRTILLGK